MGFMDKLKGTAKQAINPVGQAGERMLARDIGRLVWHREKTGK